MNCCSARTRTRLSKRRATTYLICRTAPVRQERDSRANAYRVAAREAAQWCVYGNVEAARHCRISSALCRSLPGWHRLASEFSRSAPMPIGRTCCATSAIRHCRGADASPRSQWLRSRNGHPAGQLPSFACAMRQSLGMHAERIEAIVAADPRFSPAVSTLSTGCLPAPTSAFQSNRFFRSLEVATPAARCGVRIASRRRRGRSNIRPIAGLKRLIRANPQLRDRGCCCSSLSDAVFLTIRTSRAATGEGLVSWEGVNYFPNEATHSAALAVSLDYYSNWPTAIARTGRSAMRWRVTR